MAKASGLGARVTDRIQYIKFEVVETVASTPVISAVPTSISMAEKIGIEIVEAKVFLYNNGWAAEGLVAAGDGMFAGLTQMYRGGTPPTYPNDQGVIMYERYTRAFLTGVGFSDVKQPIFHKVFPEPILVHPAALYAFTGGVSVATVCSARFDIGFRYVELTDKDYQDILQGVLLQDTL
jgi:hypothetical protein